MSAEPFIGTIQVFPYNFAPYGWTACNGQLLSISQNTALFALLGTTYGGDGKTTFALPDLRGAVPMHPSSRYPLGYKGGEVQHTLTLQEIPAHNHALQGSNSRGSNTDPANQLPAYGTVYAPSGSPQVAMAAPSVSASGNGQPHNNMQPYLVFTFCIATQGIFPPRS